MSRFRRHPFRWIAGSSAGAVAFSTVAGTIGFSAGATAASGPPSGAIIVSNHSGTDSRPGCSTAGFQNINDAVNAAGSNATIYVCDGTYDENVSINKPLTLDGAQYGVDARNRSGNETII